jgi:hypothetical protein
MDSGPNWSNAKTRSGKRVRMCSIRSSLASKSGSLDSFQIRPGPGALEGDVVDVQHLPQPLPPDPNPPGGLDAPGPAGLGPPVGPGQVAGQLAQAPPGERQPERLRAGGGRLDDERDVLVTDQAGTASRPLRVQGMQPRGVERVDHVPDRVLIRGDQSSDRWHRCPGRRRHDDHRPADPDRPVPAPPHDLLQPASFVLRQPPYPDRFSHHTPTLTQP